MGSTAYSESYTYNSSDGSLNTMTTASGNTLTMGYDGLRRLSTVTGGPVTRQYTYRDIGSSKTTMQVATFTSGGLSFGYTYDTRGNIATYAAPGEGTVTYTYDNQGQLLKAQGGTTYTYTYDTVGNLLTASDGTTAHTYTYGNTDWKDLLTAFDGQSITYDTSGNPTSYYNGTRWTMGWVNGRQLSTAQSSAVDLSFTYGIDGLRTGKAVGGISHSYLYAGGKLLRESCSGKTLDFIYDANGTPYALKYNGTVYYYVTNLQGDVVRLVDSGKDTVAEYRYDPYGKVISATGTMAEINPLRYRGYYYDSETGMYYLQSRYYDPEVGRFISADSYASTGQGIIGNNMFAYCGNNPVCATDESGTFFLYDLWNDAEDAIWKLGAKVLKALGYDLTGSLLDLAASGPNNVYVASPDSAAAKQIASNQEFVDAVRATYKSEYTGNANSQSKTYSYQFPVSQGDLGAALHNVDYSYKVIYDKGTGKQNLHVTVTDTFDFTECKNPFAQENVKAGFLWFANDIAYIDSKWGLLDPVCVEINIVIPVDP